jgi:hypothetical protein
VRAQRTKLTAFFQLNQEDPDARHLLYVQVPQHYTWQSGPQTWQKRKRQSSGTLQMIGRVHLAHPNQAERFYLRLLLHHRTGPTNFQEVRTVNGVECPTFKEACLRLQLLEDDNEWQECLKEAADTQSGPALRALLVTVFIFCEPAEPLRLYNDHMESLVQDLRRRRTLQGVPEDAADGASKNDLLCDLNDRLTQHGRSTTDFGLPAADYTQRSQLDIAADQLDPDATTTFQTAQGQLNAEQAEVFEAIRTKIDRTEGGIVFIDAPGNIHRIVLRKKKKVSLKHTHLKKINTTVNYM